MKARSDGVTETPSTTTVKKANSHNVSNKNKNVSNRKGSQCQQRHQRQQVRVPGITVSAGTPETAWTPANKQQGTYSNSKETSNCRDICRSLMPAAWVTAGRAICVAEVCCNRSTQQYHGRLQQQQNPSCCFSTHARDNATAIGNNSDT